MVCEKKGTQYNRDEFMQAAQPLIDYMQRNCTPHDTTIVNIGGAELLSGEVAFSVEVPD